MYFRYDLFLQWKSRWKTDGINSLERIGYKVISKTEEKLYTNITVDVGQPPKQEEVESLKDTGPRVSFIEYVGKKGADQKGYLRGV